MKQRFKEEQIIKILQEVESGEKVRDVCRRHNVTEQAIYRWRSKFYDMDVSDARRLKTLEIENTRLKRIVANQTLDIEALKETNSKKW